MSARWIQKGGLGVEKQSWLRRRRHLNRDIKKTPTVVSIEFRTCIRRQPLHLKRLRRIEPRCWLQ